jgi:hypothetical protein
VAAAATAAAVVASHPQSPTPRRLRWNEVVKYTKEGKTKGEKRAIKKSQERARARHCISKDGRRLIGERKGKTDKRITKETHKWIKPQRERERAGGRVVCLGS